MLRFVTFIIILMGLGWGLLWLERSNAVIDITFYPYQIHLSLLAFAIFSLIALFCCYVAYSILRAFLRAPRRVKDYWHKRIALYDADYKIQALKALFEGREGEARHFYQKIVGSSLSDMGVLRPFFEAQLALLQQNHSLARDIYEKLITNKDTALMGLFGAYQHALQLADFAQARKYAYQAYELCPDLPWAAQAIFEKAIADGDWPKAEQLFDKMERARPIAQRYGPQQRHYRALLYAAKAQDLLNHDAKAAQRTIKQALRYDSNFVPIIILAARILDKLKQKTRADKWLEQAWRLAPHPDIAKAYIDQPYRALELDKRDKANQLCAEQSLVRAERLLALAPHDFYARMAYARALKDTENWCLAERHVKEALKIHNYKSCYLLLCEIEKQRRGDKEFIHYWQEQAQRAAGDPCWVAEGIAVDHWSVLSPVSGRFAQVIWQSLDCEDGFSPPSVTTAPALAPKQGALNAQSQAPASLAEVGKIASQKTELPNFAMKGEAVWGSDKAASENLPKDLSQLPPKISGGAFIVDDPGAKNI